MDNAEALRVVASDATVSDKIRALDAAGYARAEIARLLGKRYQHVRNVLEADKLNRPLASPITAASPRVSEPPSTFGDVHRLAIGPDGTVRLPPEIMSALTLRPGGVAISHLESDRLVILSTKAAWKAAQDVLAPYRRQSGTLASDDLIADRRSGKLWDE
jgi:hypothetical protein